MQTQGNIPLRLLAAGERVYLAPDLFLEVLSPATEGGKSRMDTNDMSLVLRLTYKGKGLAVMCGDALAFSLKRITRQAKPGSLQADALILPHHASKTSLYAPFYASVQPQVALFSCGSINPYGFPAQTVLSVLREQRIPVLGTPTHGAIRLVWRYGTLEEVETFAPGGGIYVPGTPDWIIP